MSELSQAASKSRITFVVNGNTVTVRAFPMERLLDVLRLQLGLTGTKEGCGEGECGSRSVMVDGVLRKSWLHPVLQASDTHVTTIEGLAFDQHLHALQQA